MSTFIEEMTFPNTSQNIQKNKNDAKKTSGILLSNFQVRVKT